MNEKFPQNTKCCEKQTGQPIGINIAPGPITETPQQDEVCCGAPAGPQSSPFEKPGFALLDFVEEFVQTPAGPVPRVKNRVEDVQRLHHPRHDVKGNSRAKHCHRCEGACIDRARLRIETEAQIFRH